MKSEEVAQYLQDHPQFFEEHAELMSHMVIPHPHGGRTISITERQMVSLRDKNRQLEDKMGELGFDIALPASVLVTHRVEGIPVGRGLKAAAFWHGGPPFWGGESGDTGLSSPG